MTGHLLTCRIERVECPYAYALARIPGNDDRDRQFSLGRPHRGCAEHLSDHPLDERTVILL